MSPITSQFPQTDTLDLAYPVAVATFPSYDGAQRAVDYLAERDFPVARVEIVGTDVRSVERVTGRLTRARVAGAGALSGLWLGVFVGIASSLLYAHFSIGLFLITGALGAAFGTIWSLVDYRAVTRGGRRRFTSVSRIRAERYDIRVGHTEADRARAILSELTEGFPLAS